MVRFKNLISVVLIVFIGSFSQGVLATQQTPDLLLMGSQKLKVEMSWAYPSPLTLYFQQNNRKSPFRGLSTANYRGHVATWEVANNNLYLKEIRVDASPRNPEHYGISSLNPNASASGAVLADWFTGFLLADDDVAYTEQQNSKVHLFEVKKGKIHNKISLDGRDFYALYNDEQYAENNQHLLAARELLARYQDYTDFYYRLSYGDQLIADDFRGRIVNPKGSILLSLYNHDLFTWPWNWENRELNGAPNCLWQIENDSLYLKNVELFSGGGIYEVDARRLPLEQISAVGNDDKIKANWFSGVLLTYPTDNLTEQSFDWYRKSTLRFIKVEKGKVIQVAEVAPPFNFNGPNTQAAPKAFALIEQWRKENL